MCYHLRANHPPSACTHALSPPSALAQASYGNTRRNCSRATARSKCLPWQCRARLLRLLRARLMARDTPLGGQGHSLSPPATSSATLEPAQPPPTSPVSPLLTLHPSIPPGMTICRGSEPSSSTSPRARLTSMLRSQRTSGRSSKHPPKTCQPPPTPRPPRLLLPLLPLLRWPLLKRSSPRPPRAGGAAASWAAS